MAQAVRCCRTSWWVIGHAAAAGLASRASSLAQQPCAVAPCRRPHHLHARPTRTHCSHRPPSHATPGSQAPHAPALPCAASSAATARPTGRAWRTPRCPAPAASGPPRPHLAHGGGAGASFRELVWVFAAVVCWCVSSFVWADGRCQLWRCVPHGSQVSSALGPTSLSAATAHPLPARSAACRPARTSRLPSQPLPTHSPVSSTTLSPRPSPNFLDQSAYRSLTSASRGATYTQLRTGACAVQVRVSGVPRG